MRNHPPISIPMAQQGEERYRTVNLPIGLIDEVDRLIEVFTEHGYSSRADFIKQAVREKITALERISEFETAVAGELINQAVRITTGTPLAGQALNLQQTFIAQQEEREREATLLTTDRQSLMEQIRRKGEDWEPVAKRSTLKLTESRHEWWLRSVNLAGVGGPEHRLVIERR